MSTTTKKPTDLKSILAVVRDHYDDDAFRPCHQPTLPRPKEKTVAKSLVVGNSKIRSHAAGFARLKMICDGRYLLRANDKMVDAFLLASGHESGAEPTARVRHTVDDLVKSHWCDLDTKHVPLEIVAQSNTHLLYESESGVQRVIATDIVATAAQYADTEIVAWHTLPGSRSRPVIGVDKCGTTVCVAMPLDFDSRRCPVESRETHEVFEQTNASTIEYSKTTKVNGKPTKTVWITPGLGGLTVPIECRSDAGKWSAYCRYGSKSTDFELIASRSRIQDLKAVLSDFATIVLGSSSIATKMNMVTTPVIRLK